MEALEARVCKLEPVDTFSAFLLIQIKQENQLEHVRLPLKVLLLDLLGHVRKRVHEGTLKDDLAYFGREARPREVLPVVEERAVAVRVELREPPLVLRDILGEVRELVRPGCRELALDELLELFLRHRSGK